MAENIFPQQQEQQVKTLKRLLEGWRMALIPLKSIILWEQQWHPCAIIGSVSLLYFIIWFMDLNFLTTFAFVGLVLNFFDFIVPIIINSIYGESSWTVQKETMYDDICRRIVARYNKIISRVYTFYSLRENSPFMYYLISISMLLTLAWVSSAINNICLLYILSMVMLLWPGIQHRGILNILLSVIKMTPKSLKSE